MCIRDRAGAGHAGRLSGTEEKNICAVRDGWRVRAGGLVDSDFVESVFDSLYRGEGRLFRQPDLLRFDAFGRHDARADGSGVLAWLCVGLYPVSYTHLDVYKRQMLEGSEDAMRKAEAELKHYNIEVEVLKCWNN